MRQFVSMQEVHNVSCKVPKSPNFLICGAAQSGTSYLSTSISEHPEISMPVRTTPEPHFFLKAWEYEKGILNYLQTWFSEAREERAVGEKSSSYLYGGLVVARRIVEAMPSVRLIVMLRNPIERAWANYRFTVLNGLESHSFEDAIKFEAERNANAQGQWKTIKPFDYTGRSMYGKQLEEFLTVFSRDQILVLKSEDFKENQAQGFKSVFNFLDVDCSFTPKQFPRFNSPNVVSPEIQSQCRSVFGERFGEVLRHVRARSADSSHIARNSQEERALELLKGNLTDEHREIPEGVREQLRHVFCSDMVKLGKFVDFSIDDWV